MQKTDKLAERCKVLAQQLLEEQTAEEAALAKAEQHATKILELEEEHAKAELEMERLSRETYSIIGKTYDAGANAKEVFGQDCDYLKSQMEDPLLDSNSSIKASIAELQNMRETMEKMFAKMSEVSSTVAEAQKEAAELAATRAQETAKDASAAAVEAVKTAATPGAAAVAASSTKPDEQRVMARAATRLRMARSGVGLGAWEVPLALGKPVHERTPADAVAAAKAAKIARVEIAAQDQMETDLADS